MILTQSLINWCKNDTTSQDGSMLDAVSNNYGLRQLIQELTHILNSSSSFVYLIFTSQPNLVMESGARSSLPRNCHHQVVFAEFNLSVLYPLSYKRTAWFYEKANPELVDADLIGRAINEFDWIRTLSNVSVDEKVFYFTKTLRDIIHNFISLERIICDDRDPP